MSSNTKKQKREENTKPYKKPTEKRALSHIKSSQERAYKSHTESTEKEHKVMWKANRKKTFKP